MRSSENLASYYMGQQIRALGVSRDAMVVMGDLNCEPWDEPLHAFRWRGEDPDAALVSAHRVRGPVLATPQPLPYCYNPCWAFLGDASTTGGTASVEDERRPTDTWQHHANLYEPQWFDQVLVTRSCLTGDPLRLLQITIHPAIARGTDHCAISARFDTNP